MFKFFLLFSNNLPPIASFRHKTAVSQEAFCTSIRLDFTAMNELFRFFKNVLPKRD